MRVKKLERDVAQRKDKVEYALIILEPLQHHKLGIYLLKGKKPMVSEYLRNIMSVNLRDRFIETRSDRIKTSCEIPQRSVLNPTLWNII